MALAEGDASPTLDGKTLTMESENEVPLQRKWIMHLVLPSTEGENMNNFAYLISV